MSVVFNNFFFLHQVPVLIPILVLLASIYLIVAPFYEAPLESFYCLLVILAGIPVYLVFVRFNIVPRTFFVAIGKFRFRFNLLNLLTPKGRRGGLVSVLEYAASGPGSSPGKGHCVVFLGKTLYSHGASLHSGV